MTERPQSQLVNRSQFRGPFHYGTLAQIATFTLATAATPLFGWSPLHLLWVLPVSFLVGFLTLIPPFSLVLRPLGWLYGRLCCI